MSFVQMILFLLVVVVVLFGVHYLVYVTAIRLFSITDIAHQRILLAVIAFLAVSFILASLLARWYEDSLTRAFYFASGFWLGLLANLLMALLAALLIAKLGQAAGIHINTTYLGAALCVLALGVSLYGVWNAYHPVVKTITVGIPNLPAQWENKRIVQISDAHLGFVHRESFISNIIEKVNSARPDMVVITGDLFDGINVNLESLVSPLKNIEAPKGIFFVTGNHETYLGVEDAFAALKKTGVVNILDDAVADVDGLKVVGIGYPEQGKRKDIAAVLKSLQKEFQGYPTILLHHTPGYIKDVKNSGVNLQLSGHTHRGQLFPFEYIARLVYKKYEYGLHTQGAYTLYTTSGAGTWGPPMRTGNVPEITVITLVAVDNEQ